MEENKLHYHMKVRVFRKEGAFGPGVAELMHHVEETGSLSEACRWEWRIPRDGVL